MPFVVGRIRIDNFLMGVCDISHQCTLIDGTSSVPGIHIGFDSHSSRDREIRTEDYEWNVNLIEQNKSLCSYFNRYFRSVVVEDHAIYFLLKKRVGSLLFGF